MIQRVWPVLLILAASAIEAQSLDRAKLLFTNKLYEDAKKELVAVAVSDTADPESRASALNMLGSIAIEEGNYEAAITNWTELLEKYPTSNAATEARTALPLARKLAANPPGPAASAVTVTHQAAAVEEKPLEPGTVLIAGMAPEAPEYADQAILEFINLLGSHGVRVQDAFVGRVASAGMSRMEAFSLPSVFSYAKRVGAASVLYVTLHFQGMENMRVECYSPEGVKLWSEKVGASLGFGPSGMTAGFIKRMGPKLVDHVGDKCLPPSK